MTVMLTLYMRIYNSIDFLIHTCRPHNSIGARFQHNSSPQHGSLQHLLPHLHCHCPSGSGLTKNIHLEKEDWATDNSLDSHHWQWWLHPHHLHQPRPAHQHQCTDSERDHCWRLPLPLQSWPQWTDCCERNRCIPHQCLWWVDFVSSLNIFRSTNHFTSELRTGFT